MRIKTALIAAAVAAMAVAGCGSRTGSGSGSTQGSTAKAPAAAANPNAKETSPPGDIPDNTAFVRFALPAGGFSVKVPEGWGRTGSGKQVTFTSNLNSVTIERRPLSGPVNSSTVKKTDVAALRAAQHGFTLQSVGTVRRSGVSAIRIRYLAQGQPNAVTGKAVTDAVERYIFARNGTEAVLTLAGPKGSDNVDPWRTISDSLRWTA
jgi:hypothetical protein